MHKMSTQVSIKIEVTDSGYIGYSPEIENSHVQGDSFDSIINALKERLNAYLQTVELPISLISDRPIWEIAQDITQDISPEELSLLPTDGAEQHDHYIYRIPKQNR